MKVIHTFVYFSEGAPWLDARLASLYEAQKKIKALFKAEDYRVYANFKYEDPHFIYLPDIEHLHLEGKDRLKGNKIPVIQTALRLFNPDEVMLVHDFDAFQNKAMLEFPSVIYNKDIVLTPYNYAREKINTGVMFLKGQSKKADKVLQKIIDIMKSRRVCHDEPGLTWMRIQPEYKDIFGLLDSSWNFGKHDVQETFQRIGKQPNFCHFWPPQMLDILSKASILNPDVDNILHNSSF